MQMKHSISNLKVNMDILKSEKETHKDSSAQYLKRGSSQKFKVVESVTASPVMRCITHTTL